METTVKTALFPYAGLFRRLADRLDVWHKKIPFHLPESLQKIFAILFLIASVLLALVCGVMSFAFIAVSDEVSEGTFSLLATGSSVVALIICTYLYAMALIPLKRRAMAGWDYLFIASLVLAVCWFLFWLFTTFHQAGQLSELRETIEFINAVGGEAPGWGFILGQFFKNLILGVLILLVNLYILFEIRPQYH